MAFAFTSNVFAKEIHVSTKGNDQNDGSFKKPLQTIQAAANVAQPGDIITIQEGVYRERVNPPRGGTSDSNRIIYRAAKGEKVEVKGSEEIKGWEKVENGVWKVTIPNTFFKDYNPYQDSIAGDWFHRWGRVHHTGEVFLNGKSFFEKENIQKVLNPVPGEKSKDKERSLYTWYCESDESRTTIWANFHKFNPNKELVEISTRKTCFYPEKQGVDYITIQGIHFSQAATNWAAPTAEQVGMIATHWNKGWIIENNIISNSKCTGITLGKEGSTGHNVWSKDEGSINRDGNIHYIEVTFRTLAHGWNKENVGSHIVRNNQIFECGQAGICGSMGAAFSIIENNHIHHIYTKRQYGGYEMGGIKFHAAIDAIIKNNRIHDTDRGIWLDWMTQGTRVSGNLMYNNDYQDLYLEVNHGPFMVDNNILLSRQSINTQSEGGAFVHNLIAGTFVPRSDNNRFTPYHMPHSTAIKGLAIIRSGDDRFYNNIFVGSGAGTSKNGYENYKKTKFPVWIDGNIYLNGAIPYEKEQNYIEKQDFDPGIQLITEGDEVYLQCTSPDFSMERTKLVTTKLLGGTLVSKEVFDNPDGTDLEIDTDYFGKKRDYQNPSVGPFENPGSGNLKLKVW